MNQFSKIEFLLRNHLHGGLFITGPRRGQTIQRIVLIASGIYKRGHHPPSSENRIHSRISGYHK